MEVAARRATPEDLPELESMVGVALDELSPMRGGSLFVQRDARSRPLDTLVADEDAVVLIGTIDDVPVGYAAATIDVLRDDRRLAVVSDLFVESEARGVGVGEALMDAVVAWATEHRCIGIDAMVLPGNRETKNFFETFGLTARAIVVNRVLDTE